MNRLKDVNKITRLSGKFGTPLKNIEFIGEGIKFTYGIGQYLESETSRSYKNVDKGIQLEIQRLESLIEIEEDLRLAG